MDSDCVINPERNTTNRNEVMELLYTHKRTELYGLDFLPKYGMNEVDR